MIQNGNNVTTDVLTPPPVSLELSASKQTNHSCSADIQSGDVKDRKRCDSDKVLPFYGKTDILMGFSERRLEC